MKRAFVIPYTLAVAIGGGFVGQIEGLVGESKASTYQYRQEGIAGVATAGQKATVAAAIGPMVCPALDAKEGLTGADVCQLGEHFRQRGTLQPKFTMWLTSDGVLHWDANPVVPEFRGFATIPDVEAFKDGGG